ncbi:SgcJ/EcaC family oxidoreductase [Actinosynnema sp. CS-041913]|uniref:SgcJ/EcaC family oxidoreductase n=1 Tax=Actinosynnema sp. CS-041913 TaxID=3239917 RepID=UPI003D8F3092
MAEKAESLVVSAKKWATYYGEFSNGEKGAALTAALRFRAAWEENDPDALAGVFLDNGSMLSGHIELKNRREIRDYHAEAFRGGFRGTRLAEVPREVTLVNDSVAIAITEGGIVRDGADTPEPADTFRCMWVIVKRDGDWRIASHQTSPMRG